MKFFRKRSNLFITGIALAAIVGGAWYFAQTPQAEANAAPELQTAKVRTGDLAITANGAGTIIPAAQVELGFRSSGVVGELNVSVGDEVAAGQVLARLEGSPQAEADFQALFTPYGVAQADAAVAAAGIAVDDTVEYLMYLISPEVYYFEEDLAEAQALLDGLNSDSTATEAARTEAQENLTRAGNNLKAAQIRYINEYSPAYFTYSWIDEVTGEEVTGVIPPSDADITVARAAVEAARVALQDAQAALEIVQAEPGALTAPLVALGPQTAKLEQARQAVESVRLTAPFDGTVTSLNAVVGQTVGTSPILSLETTLDLLVRFYLDETDVSKAIPGRPVVFTFDAYPDATVTGEIVLVEPALQTVDGTPVVVVWASLPDDTPFAILSGMTVEAEVIAAESRDTLIVPVQALRELSPGSFAVFIVQPDGTLKMTPVTVGLRDFANAEILSGLKVGDVVSTGTMETK